MVDVYELEPEAAQVLGVSGLDLAQVALLYPELLELAPHEPEREPRAVHRHVELAQDVGQGPHVVLVGVGEHYALELVGVLAQEREVRQDQVDPRHLLVREGHPGVD